MSRTPACNQSDVLVMRLERGCASRNEARMHTEGATTAGPCDNVGIAARQHRGQHDGKPLWFAVVCTLTSPDA